MLYNYHNVHHLPYSEDGGWLCSPNLSVSPSVCDLSTWGDGQPTSRLLYIRIIVQMAVFFECCRRSVVGTLIVTTTATSINLVQKQKVFESTSVNASLVDGWQTPTKPYNGLMLSVALMQCILMRAASFSHSLSYCYSG